MITWHELTGFQRDTLEAIARLERRGETTYGLAIKREIERSHPEKINHGQLYPNLDTLVGSGLVEKSKLDGRTNRYDLTDDGRDVLEARARDLAESCGIDLAATDGGDQA